jgi:hypothetical protein
MFSTREPKPSEEPDASPQSTALPWIRGRIDRLYYLVAQRPVKFTFREEEVQLGENDVIVFRGDEDEAEDIREKVRTPLLFGPLCIFSAELNELDSMAAEAPNYDLPDHQMDPFLDDLWRTRGRLVSGVEQATDRMRVPILGEVGEWLCDGRVPDDWSYDRLFDTVRGHIEV